MNILYVNANPRHRLSDISGYATHMLKTIKGFEADGHQVTKLIAGEGKKAEQAKKNYRSLDALLPTSFSRAVRDIYEIFHDIRISKSWYPIARKNNVDFIYERMNSFHACGYMLSRKIKKPLVLEINDPLRESLSVNFSFLKFYAVLLEDYLLRKADIIILGSHALKSYYVKRKVNRDKLLVLYPTADFDLFDKEYDREMVKKEYNLEHKIVIGFVAGNIFSPWLKVDLLIRAINKICETHSNVAGLIVGEGDSKRFNEKGISPDLLENVKITGKLPYLDIPKCIAAMDICIIPNATWYGSPTKLFEFGIMGKPVIAANYPPIAEIIDDKVTGLLFTPEDQNDLVNKINYLIENPACRRELGVNLKKKIMDEITWEDNTRKIIELIDRLKQRYPRKLG